MLSDLCLSVTLVYCGLTVGWTKMKLGSGNIVLGGDPVPLPHKGHSTPPPFSAHICCIVVAKWLDGSRCHLVGRKASTHTTLCYC